MREIFPQFEVVIDTTKIQLFKQITTNDWGGFPPLLL